MREIVFRGKRVEDGKWVEGFYSQFHNRPIIPEPNIHQIFTLLTENDEPIILGNTSIGGLWHTIDPNTLCEFTGLCDKNGKKIFEGDVVKYTRTNMYAPSTNFHNQDLVSLHKIYWNDEKYCFYQDHYTEERCIGSGGINFEDDRAEDNIIEIIGNIYDNPELLEGKDG